MKPSRYDDDDRWPPMRWYEWVVMGLGGCFLLAFTAGSLWFAWRAVFG